MKQCIKIYKKSILIILCLTQLVSGFLNQSNCVIQPNISKWLIIDGFLMIILNEFIKVKRALIKRTILIFWKILGI